MVPHVSYHVLSHALSFDVLVIVSRNLDPDWTVRESNLYNLTSFNSKELYQWHTSQHVLSMLYFTMQCLSLPLYINIDLKINNLCTTIG